MERDQEFVLTVVKYLVENPDDVKVDRKIDEMGVLLTLTVNPADMGKIIGKEGRTAKAIRTLLRVIGAKMDARVNLKIEEPEGSTYVRPTDSAAAAAFNQGSDDTASDVASASGSATTANDDASQDAQDNSPATDFDPLATSKSIYGEDSASAGSNLDTDTTQTESGENPTSIL